jgi:hypothetical protein
VTAIRLLCAWLLGWVLHECPVFIKLGGIINLVVVFARSGTLRIPNFEINYSVCMSILTWFKNIFFQSENFHYWYNNVTIHYATTVQEKSFWISVHFNKYRKDSTLTLGFVYLINTFLKMMWGCLAPYMLCPDAV